MAKYIVFALRWVQFGALCSAVWFASWFFIYEVGYWRKPIWEALGNSFANALALEISVMTMVFAEFCVRRYHLGFSRKTKLKRKSRSASQKIVKLNDFERFPSVVKVEEKSG